MVDLFLDIETVPDMETAQYLDAVDRIGRGELTENDDLYWKCTRGSLRYSQGRVILITYRINRAPVRRLMEWKDTESRILKSFYILLQDLQRHRGEDPLRIIGHNILTFDVFFLYNRMRILGIDNEAWLQQWVFNGPIMVDLLQLHLPLNGMSARGLKHDVLAHAYGLPTKDDTGDATARQYFDGRYQDILEYSRREFVYPEMFERINAGGLISAQALAESISWYESR